MFVSDVSDPPDMGVQLLYIRAIQAMRILGFEGDPIFSQLLGVTTFVTK